MHPPSCKEFTNNKAIEAASIPDIVIIPMQQHIGAPCEPIVNVKAKVKKGQKVGEGALLFLHLCIQVFQVK